jgi:hypothetical protein
MYAGGSVLGAMIQEYPIWLVDRHISMVSPCCNRVGASSLQTSSRDMQCLRVGEQPCTCHNAADLVVCCKPYSTTYVIVRMLACRPKAQGEHLFTCAATVAHRICCRSVSAVQCPGSTHTAPGSCAESLACFHAQYHPSASLQLA